MVAFTNHALDHLLESVLDANITQKVVRLGSRSQSEKLQALTLDKLEKFQGDFMRRGFSAAYGAMKGSDKAFNEYMQELGVNNDQSFGDLESHLQLNYPEHHESLITPAEAVRSIRNQRLGPKAFQFLDQFEFWEKGRDVKNNARRKARPVALLLQVYDVWGMTLEERKRLSEKWKQEVSTSGEEARIMTYESLKKTHREAAERVDEYQMMVRLI